MNIDEIQGYQTSADMQAEIEAEEAEYLQREHADQPAPVRVRTTVIPERGFAI